MENRIDRITIEKIVAGGSGLGKVGGKNVFVPFSAPGDVLEVEAVRRARDYDEARIVRVLEPSPHRAEPFCPLYGTCGGCSLQHVSEDYQRTVRAGILAECFRREGVDAPEVQVVSGRQRGYRARVQLTDGGFKKKGSDDVVALPQCPVATDEVNAYLAAVPQGERPAGRAHVFADSRLVAGGGAGAVKAAVAPGEARVRREARVIGAGAARAARVRARARRNVHFSGTPADGAPCTVELSGRRISFDARGFFQSNMEVLEKALPLITANLGGRNALDLYAGCGTLSAFTAPLFGNTVLVEHNRDALVHAERNLAGVRHESYGQDAARWARESAPGITARAGAFDAVVVDPPRQGMDAAVRGWLCGNKAGQVRSLSCDPVTHARDARALVEAGYTLSRLYLLDFYPQTAHVESLAFFEHYA